MKHYGKHETSGTKQMILLIDNLSHETAEVYALVLASANIPHRLLGDGFGWGIYVRESDFEIAADGIERYCLENPEKTADTEENARDWPMTFSAVWAAALPAAFHAAISGGGDREFFVRVYGSSASHILDGELYRCVTSLLLHADIAHLAGNIAGIIIFGTAVCAYMGWGAGWLGILAAGIIGNWINACLYGSGHVSIGASTAVFGAVGVLSACRFVDKIGPSGRGIRAMAPLIAGIALLGFLGSSPHSDITAHLFGFASGILIGGIYAFSTRGLPARSPISGPWQFVSAIIALGILAAAWARGLA